jgi:TolB-like protein
MAPEQALGHAVDPRADLFSLGVLLYQMATGRRPFHANSASETVAALLRDDPPKPSSLNPGVPEELDALIAHCLEKDVAHRLPSARELRQRLQILAARLSAPAPVFPTETRRITRLRRRWQSPMAAFALTGCLTLLATFAGPKMMHFGAADPQRPGLAVLPLGNFSNDPDYFADGMTDALIASLSDTQGVRVLSRQSVMRYKGSSETLPEIARELGVDVVVQGSVMRAGNRVRITAQLIQADPEQQIWARSYERDLDDVLSVQQEVARAVSGEVQARLLQMKKEAAEGTIPRGGL